MSVLIVCALVSICVSGSDCMRISECVSVLIVCALGSMCVSVVIVCA